MSKQDKLKRWLTNAFIASVVVLFTIDVVPPRHRFHRHLQETIDPLLDVTGLWQGPWNLFAPEPDKENSRVSAEVHYPDGTVYHWKSPDWTDKSSWYRFRHFRTQEYFDKIRMDDNRTAWPALARHVLQQAKENHPSQYPPAQIFLIRHWWKIPPPKEQFTPAKDINKDMQSFRFYHQVIRDWPLKK